MKKTILTLIFFLFLFTNSNSETKVNPIYEGKNDAKIHIIVYESLTCGHDINFMHLVLKYQKFFDIIK